jgi:predicted nucleic acid-binding protein
MVFVLDASIAAAWFLPDEHNDAADRLMAALKSSPARVPALFWFEARNLFLVAERRERLRAGEASLCMAQLRRLPIDDHGCGEDQLSLALAARHSLSAYDAAYLALALEGGVPLATTDKKLAGAAHAERVTILGLLAKESHSGGGS